MSRTTQTGRTNGWPFDQLPFLATGRREGTSSRTGRQYRIQDCHDLAERRRVRRAQQRIETRVTNRSTASRIHLPSLALAMSRRDRHRRVAGQARTSPRLPSLLTRGLTIRRPDDLLQDHGRGSSAVASRPGNPHARRNHRLCGTPTFPRMASPCVGARPSPSATLARHHVPLRRHDVVSVCLPTPHVTAWP
jgi:hypothetical protein